MDREKGRTKVVAIIPAFNEGKTISRVLEVIASYPGFDDVLVVDDGSTDDTALMASRFPVRVIRNAENLGKGRAMEKGVAATNASILFFCDADMHGFTHEMLETIVRPVLEGESEMVIAMRNWRMYYAGFVLSIIPILGGQRALTRELWNRVPSEYKERFMIETALNFYARYWGNGFQYKVCSGLTQTIKEEKYGFWKGFRARILMSAEVVFAQIRLQLSAVPPNLRTGRVALRNTAVALGGTLIGALTLIASYRGPVAFVREMFAKELRQDPDAPFVQLLLYLASNLGAELIALIGISLISLNILVVVLNFPKLRYLGYKPAPAQRVG